MYIVMDHQDWEQVVFTTYKKPENKSNLPIKTNHQKKLESNDIVVAPKIDLNLKKSISQARTNNKLTQKELATKMNVPVQTIINYENGKAIPNNLFISKLEKTLKTKLPRVKKQTTKEN